MTKKQASIGKCLISLRTKNGYSIEEIADNLGKTVDEVESWERGNKPDDISLKSLSILYNVPLSSLIELYNSSKEMQYPFLPAELINLKLSKSEQALLGNMYLRIKTNNSYVAIVEEQNPFVITSNVNNLVKMGLIEKKINEFTNELQYVLSALGISVCEVIEKNPEQLFDIQKADNKDILHIMASKYFGFGFEAKQYTMSRKYVPAERCFDFLSSDKQFIYEEYEDCDHKKLLNTELYEFVTNALPSEFYEIQCVESQNEDYLRRKEIINGIRERGNTDVDLDKLCDKYIRPSKKGTAFAKYFANNCNEFQYLISKIMGNN